MLWLGPVRTGRRPIGRDQKAATPSGMPLPTTPLSPAASKWRNDLPENWPGLPASTMTRDEGSRGTRAARRRPCVRTVRVGLPGESVDPGRAAVGGAVPGGLSPAVGVIRPEQGRAPTPARPPLTTGCCARPARAASAGATPPTLPRSGPSWSRPGRTRSTRGHHQAARPGEVGHGGPGLHTAADVHYGKAADVQAGRTLVLNAARGIQAL
jgi:hypothetical protein